ncbi:MAG: ribonuclease HIII [Erysipelotrichaceae bacterium]|nr:ribonuclease HIII [Erysipelotrichaceae bacterium]
MSTFSLKLDDEKILKLKDTFKDYIQKSPNEYVDTFIQKEDLTITIYSSKKVVFQGNDAFFYAQAFIDSKPIRQAGSDEVGNGDVFGPVCVCAAIVEADDYDYITEKNITDSKALNDDYIRKIGPELLRRFKHSLLILDNKTYNVVHETSNLNAIKAKMHNKAYLNLIDKGYEIPKLAYVDQFCSFENYFSYLIDEPRIYRDLIFETKAEEKYPAVAVGSIISRYAFLEYMDKMSERYHMSFHRGSSDTEAIDKDIETFVSKYGRNELKNVAKMHFKNLEKYR